MTDQVLQCDKKDISIKYPLSLYSFLSLDIPPVKYILKPVLPEKGKLILSAHQESCKTFWTMAAGVTIASGFPRFLGTMEVSQAKVLCLFGEGGVAETMRRLKAIASISGIDTGNLDIHYAADMDIHDGVEIQPGFEALKASIEESQPDVLILDPIGQFWTGEEIKKEHVKRLTTCLDLLIEKYDLSLIITHHWKKPSMSGRSGGAMASGSYWWTAWVDGHITLKRNGHNLTMSFEKVRSGIKPKDKLTLRLREEDLWLECIGKEGELVTDIEVDELFESFQLNRVKLSDMAKKAKEQDICSRNTLEKVLGNTPKYLIDTSDKRCFAVILNPDYKEGNE